MPSSYIVAASRTPIGKFQGSLAAVTAPHLGAVAVREALKRSGLAAESIDEVILGNVVTAGVGQAPARQAALAAGLPPTIPALTINKVCGSGLKAVMLADQAIRAGDARAIIAGGMESMSNAPYLLPGARRGWTYGHQQAIDALLHDGLWCAHEHAAMGELAEHTAVTCGVSRADQDDFALSSHRRAVSARDSGAFVSEIVSVTVPRGKEAIVVDKDEGPRGDTTLERLSSLRPAFGEGTSITAGNASQLSDGAAAVVVVDEPAAREIDSPVKARIVAAAASGVAPRDLFVAPVSAIERVLGRACMTLADIDLVELNEAFAAQCLACMRPLGLAQDKVNVAGGAIALGHPIGASGARVLVTLLHLLAARNLRRGLAALCLGGGNAVAMIVERQD